MSETTDRAEGLALARAVFAPPDEPDGDEPAEPAKPSNYVALEGQSPAAKPPHDLEGVRHSLFDAPDY